MNIKKSIGAIILLFYCLHSLAAENLVLITIDGLRWQEVFHGLDQSLTNNKDYNHRPEALKNTFCEENNCQGSQNKLMPFLHKTIATQGVLYGDKLAGQCMQVTNPWFFSYPGYNEILTGYGDPTIDSNNKIANKNTTILEWLNQQKDFKNKVVAFTSWDVFPYIINTERSGVPVNAAFNGAAALNKNLSQKEAMLDTLLKEIPSPWETVRLDAFTHHYALEKIRKDKPRVIYISYGETDDFAHDGSYDQYVLAAQRTDKFIEEIWNTLQKQRDYRGKTQLIITTDHGRGSNPIETWQHHASKKSLAGYMNSLQQYPDGIVGSDDVWFAAIGPSVRSDNAYSQLQSSKNCLGLNQIAATAMASLGINWQDINPQAGAPLPILTNNAKE